MKGKARETFLMGVFCQTWVDKHPGWKLEERTGGFCMCHPKFDNCGIIVDQFKGVTELVMAIWKLETMIEEASEKKTKRGARANGKK